LLLLLLMLLFVVVIIFVFLYFCILKMIKSKKQIIQSFFDCFCFCEFLILFFSLFSFLSFRVVCPSRSYGDIVFVLFFRCLFLSIWMDRVCVVGGGCDKDYFLFF